MTRFTVFGLGAGPRRGVQGPPALLQRADQVIE